jgi:hypothetical protein
VKSKLAITNTIIDFFQDNNCIIFNIQELCLDYGRLPPTYPDSYLITPSAAKPKYTMYIRKIPNITYLPSFEESNSFLGVKIHIPNLIPFKLYNFYSLGRPNALASMLDSFLLQKLSIIVGDFNAHHTW